MHAEWPAEGKLEDDEVRHKHSSLRSARLNDVVVYSMESIKICHTQ